MMASDTTVPVFQVRDLSVIEYANGFTDWHYKARGLTLAQVMQPAFFNPAYDMIEPGDNIRVSAEDAGALLYVKSSQPGGVVARVMASSEP